MNAWRRQGWLMTAHTQPERRPESEPGFDEAKVRRIICVVVSMIAVSAGSLIGMAESIQAASRLDGYCHRIDEDGRSAFAGKRTASCRYMA